ncbi:hypothetical protein BCR42DRAFT_165326 [Absidia repens]|uniref:LUC7-domain-containing protein n=1 Tax=Absidia repens TaxID=90262 RepID=A0A1X2IVM3_9FUNG|nr:hypothetical protein BCR42DRAFT_165326 [Absidia repens]
MIPASNKSSTGTVSDICSDYLCGLCPYDLLRNTSGNQGPCPKLHSEEAKQLYDESLPTSPEISVINEHLRSLEEALSARDRKVKEAKLWLTPLTDDTDETKKIKDRIERYEHDISKYELRRDTPHQDIIAQHDIIKSQSRICERLQQSMQTSSATARHQRQVSICGVCGCYVDHGLSNERKSLHEKPGGVHDAYIKIASKVAEIKNAK